MNVIRDEFFGALLAETAAGHALDAFAAGLLQVETHDLKIGAGTKFPLLGLMTSPATVSDEAQTSRFVIIEGVIDLWLAVLRNERSARKNDEARVACETHQANLERVLLGLRYHQAGGVIHWNHMEFTRGEGGVLEGPGMQAGLAVYGIPTRCTFRALRTRAA